MESDSQSIAAIRKRMADLCLRTSDTDLGRSYQHDFGNTYRALLGRLLIERPVLKTKAQYAKRLRAQLSGNKGGVTRIGALLAAMLYHRAHDLGFFAELRKLPAWFLDDYLAYMSKPALMFLDSRETERYLAHMRKWIGYLHTSITSDAEPKFWRNIAEKFLQICDFGPLYFNDANLRDLYELRGEIIEHVLRGRGYDLDHTFSKRRGNEAPVRLGILANHFAPHPETFATLPVYEYLSPNFVTTLYSLHKTDSPLETYCSSRASELKLLPASLRDQVELIRHDELDILFVATNITAVANPVCLLAAHRLARKQVVGVGSVTTTGLSNSDYFLTGRLTDNSDNASHYTESLLWLSRTAHCFSYGNDQPTERPPVNREKLHIDERSVVYASGANMFKMSPELLNAWGCILNAVPSSTIMLYPYGPNWSSQYPKPMFVDYLRATFARHQIGKNRIIILDPQPVPDRHGIREYLRVADVYLDSFPFSGTTSLIEPLETRLPIVTKQGRTFRAAMGAALIKAVGADELIAGEVGEYIEIAVEIGKDSLFRTRMQERIKAGLEDSPPFLDSARYSKDVESLFHAILAAEQREIQG